jgi:hypothetical protein
VDLASHCWRAAGEDLSTGAAARGQRRARRSRQRGWRAALAHSRASRLRRQLLREIGQADVSAVGWAVYLGVFPTALAFTTWAHALARTTAERMGATAYLVPPLTVLMGWAILDDILPAMALLGGMLCLVGIAVTRR